MVGLQTLDLAIGVRVPASQPTRFNKLRATRKASRPFCVPMVCQSRISLDRDDSLSPLYQLGGPRSVQLALKLQF
jgi:hypothetical protein